MKKMKAVITVVAIFLASIGLIPTAQANGDLDQILANMQNAGGKIKTLSSNILQEKKSSQHS